LAAAVLLISGVLLARLWFPAASSPGVTGEPAADATPVPRWRERTALPGARAGLAAAAYEGQIYAIGGEDAQGPVAAVERYDPQSDGWQALAPKPLAVTDVQAGVIGGKLYLPGGRVDAAAVTDRLEIYDPRQDRWSQGAALPVGLSAYALATFEGRLYLFGGWDGKQYTGQALVYDPALDAWQQLAPMPTWRGFAGAAVAEGKIYVIGGQDENGPLAVNEAYLPDLDQAGSQPWTQAAALPSGRSAMGIASLAEVIHVIGGQAGGAPLLSYAYAPQTDSWQELYFPPGEGWSHLGVVPLGTYLYTLGGKVGDGLSAQNIVYQAIFTVAIPVIR
jgi:N-acetylneuraminic acid mutarotase